MYCHRCGQQVVDSALFCVHCGQKLQQAQEEKVYEEPAVTVAEIKEQEVNEQETIASDNVQEDVADVVIEDNSISIDSSLETDGDTVSDTYEELEIESEESGVKEEDVVRGSYKEVEANAISSVQRPSNSTYNSNKDSKLEEPMTIGDWVITFLVMSIPVVNIIMFFVWAFGADVKQSKKTYFQASLIFAAIGILVALVFGLGLGFFFASIGSALMY